MRRHRDKVIAPLACALTVLAAGGCSLEGEAPITTSVELVNQTTASTFELWYALVLDPGEDRQDTRGLGPVDLDSDQRTSFGLDSDHGALIDVRIDVDTQGTRRSHGFTPMALTAAPYGELIYTHVDDGAGGFRLERDYR